MKPLLVGSAALVVVAAAALAVLGSIGGCTSSVPAGARISPGTDPAQPSAEASAPLAEPVTASAETAPVPNDGDAADDPAIWIHPDDRALSTIIGTDKRGGLAVYDLAGRQLHYYADSRPNNVDLRSGFPLGDERVTLVATSDTETDAIRVYRVDPATRGLEYVAARTLAVGVGLYGLCMYRSEASAKYYVIDSDSSGTVQQWELYDDGSGKVDAKKVRSLRTGSTTEGCVADDDLGHLYVAEEDVGIWKYGAEPEAGTARTAVDRVESGRLTADIEGLALYNRPNGKGYLIASSQGSNEFAVYERSGANGHVFNFTVSAGAIDGVTYTDGIDVTAAALGSAFPDGLFAAQDDSNDEGNQNFKLVSWRKIIRAADPQLAADAQADAGREAGTASTPWPTTGATTYYVDAAGGSDANTGTSRTSAWQTLEKASAAPLAPGDRLLLRRGGVWSEKLTVAASGTSARPVVVGAYGDGARPLIRRAPTCVVLSGSHLVLRDLAIEDCAWAGVDVAGSSNRVERNVIARNAAGIRVRAGATGNSVLRNELVDNNRMSVLTKSPSDDDSGAFGILLQGDRTEVAYNTISGSDAFSHDYGRDGAAVEIYGGTGNHVHHNVGLENDAFAELGNSRSADNTFAYNVVRSSLETSVGFVTRGADSGHGPVLATALLNNTIFLAGRSSQGFVCHAGCGPDILKMRNNIVQAGWKVGYADAAFDEDYGVFYGGQTQFEKGRASIVADPEFVDPASGNLRLRPTSAGVDACLGGLGYAQDVDRTAVPADGDGDGLAETDCGAFEYEP